MSVAMFSTLSLAEAYLAGDFNSDLAIDATDYNLFVAAYDAVNGAGSFASATASVPEPSSVMLSSSWNWHRLWIWFAAKYFGAIRWFERN